MTLLKRTFNEPLFWSGELPVTNRYTYGIAGEKFFRALKEEGSILGTFCPECQRTYVPGTSFCERCFIQLTDWIDMGLIGKIHTYTLLYKNVDETNKSIPELIAFIRFGNGGLVHKIKGIELENVYIGMEVAAKLKPKNHRKGNIQDIKYFMPVSKNIK
jgi:uncharacterized OB-fold protein